MFQKLRNLADIFINPIPNEVQNNRKLAWDRLPENMKHSRQIYGSYTHHCGATIGAMPRCDFACQGCYLGENANQIPAQPVDEIKRQMRVLRPFLGFGGNLQLTDGEVTLRPEEEVIELIRYARSIDLIPMLMTHGDTFRRKPGLLEKLIEAGLTEVSIHVDTDMKGRKGKEYKYAKEEEALNPLRDEFAKLLRSAQKNTGRKISAATTMTVTAENLRGIPTVMQWLVKNADVFKLISFQPIAQVGRTEEGLGGGVSVEDLWRHIAEGLYGKERHTEKLQEATTWVGHKDCNRQALGFVVEQPDESPFFEPLCNFDSIPDKKFLDRLLATYGGLNFRVDSPLEAAARILGGISLNPGLAFRLLPYVADRLRRIDSKNSNQLLKNLLRKKAKVHGLNIISHHFMSQNELESDKGQERLDLCIFKVPIGDKLVSMCEVNATNIRDDYYEDIRSGKRPSTKKPKKKLAVVNT